jgi:MraZ protein
VRHGILCGEYELTIDDKNRLLIPSDVRKAVDQKHDGNGFFIIIGDNGKPWLYPDKFYEAIVNQAPSEMLSPEVLRDYDLVNFANANRVSVDKQGRILLPERVLRRTNTERSITLLGARNHLQIWNRTDWEKHFEIARTQRSELAARARLALLPLAQSGQVK